MFVLRNAEKALPLPDGWARTESRSRPGETVYVNEFTQERQAWFPDAPAIDPELSDEDVKKEALFEKNKKALERRKFNHAAQVSQPFIFPSFFQPSGAKHPYSLPPSLFGWQKEKEATKLLPEGWRRCDSRSRPGEVVYENIHTEERIAWFPTENANKEGMSSFGLILIRLHSNTVSIQIIISSQPRHSWYSN